MYRITEEKTGKWFLKLQDKTPPQQKINQGPHLWNLLVWKKNQRYRPTQIKAHRLVQRINWKTQKSINFKHVFLTISIGHLEGELDRSQLTTEQLQSQTDWPRVPVQPVQRQARNQTSRDIESRLMFRKERFLRQTKVEGSKYPQKGWLFLFIS